MKPVAELISELARLDALLKPIANTPVDINDPSWAEQLKRLDPLARAGIKPEAQELLSEILMRYVDGTESEREELRESFQKFSSFAWAATPREPLPTPAGLRAHLLLLSIQDQGKDARDAIMTIDYLRSVGSEAGIDIGPVVSEVVELSSSRNRYGMGSMKAMLTRSLHSTPR